MPSKFVSELGESGLLALLTPYCLPGMIGDDAAVLGTITGSLVVTTDMLVENVHFSDLTTPAHAVGWRAAAANLSDLAAMGSHPVGLVVGLGIPGSTPVAWVEGLYQGLRDCCQHWQTGIVGGDLCRAAQRVVSITALGRGDPQRLIRRQDAQVGDWLVATGNHGSSRAGLELLLKPDQGQALDATARRQLIQAHQYPHPRLDVLAVLSALPLTRCGGMDSSDGLADAVIQICKASQVSARLDPAAIPLAAALQQGFPAQAMEWALYGGEDFELVLSLPPDLATKMVEQCRGAVVIGVVEAGSPTTVWLGTERLSRTATFQHFGP